MRLRADYDAQRQRYDLQVVDDAGVVLAHHQIGVQGGGGDALDVEIALGGGERHRIQLRQHIGLPDVPLQKVELQKVNAPIMAPCDCDRCKQAKWAGLSHKQIERAEQTAEKLLRTVLNAQQTREWDTERRFNVTTPAGSLYDVKSWGRIGHTYNVRLIHGHEGYERARPGYYMCAYALGGWLPMCDHIVAQKLLLEAPGGEAAFLAVANIQRNVGAHYLQVMPN